MTREVIISPVRRDSILKNWGSIEPHLGRVLEQIDSGHSVEDVLSKLQRTEQQLWNIDDWRAIAVTQITILPRHKVLSVVYVAGAGIADWRDALLQVLRGFAASHGCKYIEMMGREGWRRMLKPLGFEQAFTVMRLEVDDGRNIRRRQQRHDDPNGTLGATSAVSSG